MIETSEPGVLGNASERLCANTCRVRSYHRGRKKMILARGAAVIDVYAIDRKAILPSSCVIECKFWRKRVPQSVVHAVRSVVADSGASHGFIISAQGFQKGAHEAAKFTNV